MVTSLLVGGSGATGRLLVRELLSRGSEVKVLVRSPDKMPPDLRRHERLSVIPASVLDLSDNDLARYVQGCDAVASCLGHNLTFKGIFGHPRRLVTEATRRLCKAVTANAAGQPTRFVLMNTAGNSNRDLPEPVSFGERCVLGLLRRLLPPHVDNEQAADYLRTAIGQDDQTIEWSVVRPDTLIDEDRVTGYEVHRSPTRSAIFNPGKTSRINVAHFMAELLSDENLWNRWQGQMPVIYNQGPSSLAGRTAGSAT